MKELVVFIGLLSANFIVQSLTTELYMVALERSYFQGIALLTYWICTKILGSDE